MNAPDREKQLTEALRELKDLKASAANWARDKKNLEVQVRGSGGDCRENSCAEHAAWGRACTTVQKLARRSIRASWGLSALMP